MPLPAAASALRSLMLPGGPATLRAQISVDLAAENHSKIWDQLTVCVVLRGSGTFESAGGRIHDLGPGSRFLHPTGRWHRIRRRNTAQWVEASVGFHDGLGALVLGLGLVDLDRPVDRVADLDAWTASHAALRRALADPGVNDRHCLLAAFATLAAEDEVGEGDGDPIARSRIDLANDLRETIDLVAYARRLGLSYAHFRRRFAAATGSAPAAWRRRHRLDHAALLLRHQGFSVAEAAEAVGYATPFAFSRSFSAHFGISPSAYARGGS